MIVYTFHVYICLCLHFYIFFFFNDPATTEIYTLSLHDALPICPRSRPGCGGCSSRPRTTVRRVRPSCPAADKDGWPDRKSTRLNSSHQIISYAVFCLKKKKKKVVEYTW